MLSSTLLGQDGPYNQVSGFGSQGAGMAGIQDLAGWPDRAPAGPFGPYTDYPAPRFALTALLAALDHRNRTGQGVFIDQAQAEGTLQLLAPALINVKNGGPALERRGNDDPQMSPHGVYPCAPPQGRTESWVAIAVASDDQWTRLAPIVGGNGSLSLDDRRQRQQEIDEQIAAWTSRRDAGEVETVLQTLGISAHRLATTEDAANDPPARAPQPLPPPAPRPARRDGRRGLALHPLRHPSQPRPPRTPVRRTQRNKSSRTSSASPTPRSRTWQPPAP